MAKFCKKFISKPKKDGLVKWRQFEFVDKNSANSMRECKKFVYLKDGIAVDRMKGIGDLHRFKFQKERIIAHTSFSMKEKPAIYKINSNFNSHFDLFCDAF